MKKYISLLLLLALIASCEKAKEHEHNNQLQCNAKQLPNDIALRKRKSGHNPHGGGTDTTVVPPNNIIFYSFYGDTVTGTSWNYNGDIICDSSGLNELQIDTTMQRATKAFDSLNVVITKNRSEFNAAPASNRQKIVFTKTSSWFGRAAGTSFVGSFGTEQPAWVFTELLNFKAYKIKEIACHETGHTLGCQHDVKWDLLCADFTLSRFKIMGYTYDAYENSWGEGPTPDSCNSNQNAVKTMAARVGWKY